MQDGFLIGGFQNETSKSEYPCYVTPAGEERVDFHNGSVCYRLYTCSVIPHIVTSNVISQNKVAIGSVDKIGHPYNQLMLGLAGRLPGANNQTSLITNYEQQFDNGVNRTDFVAEIEVNGPQNLFWAVDAILTKKDEVVASNSEIPTILSFDGVSTTIPTSQLFDGAYNDTEFPQSVMVVTYIGLDHVSYSQIKIYQTGSSIAPSPGCDNSKLNAISAGTAIASGILAVFAILASPETGGASLAVAAGIFSGAFSIASGGLSVEATKAC
jgi:hypothetical protein